MLHRYHDITYIFSLDLETGLELILKAKQEERDRRIFEQWVAQLPFMAFVEQPMSFEDYRDMVTGANIDTRPTSEILAELDEIEKEFYN